MAERSTSVKVTLKVSSFILRILLNIAFYILIVIATVYVSKAAYNFTYQLYGPVTAAEAPGTRIHIIINKGESTMDVAAKLELNRAIVNKYSFFVKTKLQNLKIMPGTYEIYTSMTYKEILEIITDYSKSKVQEENTEVE
ncbi:MAG TPA: hypothetical protein VJZ06_05295 [Mobilitalea sp.]|nr:hypothetical protein [Mobilitalea sp.]